MAFKKKENAPNAKPARMTEGVENGRRARLRPIGVIRSFLKSRGQAPKQGSEGAPDAWLEVSPFAVQGLDGLVAGDDKLC